MSFGDAVSSGFSNYVTFGGRAPRSEYWFWVLFEILAAIVALFVDGIIGTVGILYIITILGLLLPSLAMAVRRMHDIDKSGRNLLWALVPFGSLYVLYLAVQPGTAGANSHGADPFGVAGGS